MKIWWKIILKEHKNIIIWYFIFFDLRIILKNKIKARNSVKWWAFKIKKKLNFFLLRYDSFTQKTKTKTQNVVYLQILEKL